MTNSEKFEKLLEYLKGNSDHILSKEESSRGIMEEIFKRGNCGNFALIVKLLLSYLPSVLLVS